MPKHFWQQQFCEGNHFANAEQQSSSILEKLIEKAEGKENLVCIEVQRSPHLNSGKILQIDFLG